MTKNTNKTSVLGITFLIIGIALLPILFSWLRLMLTGGQGLEFLAVFIYTLPAIASPLCISLGIYKIIKSRQLNRVVVNKTQASTVNKPTYVALIIAAVLVGGFMIVDSIYVAYLLSDPWGILIAFFPLIFLVLATILFVALILGIKKFNRSGKA